MLPSYTHIINPKLKHIYLNFESDGTLIIKSPKVAHKYIENILFKRADWINKTRKKLKEKKGAPLDFQNDMSLYFRGESHNIKLIHHEKQRTKLTFDGNIFILYYQRYNEETFHKCIDTFYKEAAKLYIPTIVEIWAKKMNLTPNKLSFRKTRRQWGSCSGKNDLSFNTMMMKLPISVIQYIIIHELAHIKHKHHQKSFWLLVEQYLPHYKKEINTLKSYTT